MLGLCACAQSPRRVQLFETPWSVAVQAPLSTGFPRQESLEWVVISFSRRSSWPRDLTHVSSPCTGRWILYHWAPGKPMLGLLVLYKLFTRTQCQLASCCSVALSCLTLYNPMDCSTLGSLYFTVSWSLLKLPSIESVMLSNHLVLCCPLLLLL